MYRNKQFFLFSFLLLLLCSPLYKAVAQDDKSFRLGTFGEYSNLRIREGNAFGLEAELFVHRNFSLNYRFSVGYYNKELYFHLPLIIAITRYTGSADLAFLGFLWSEGASIHFYPNERFEIAPFLNPLGADIMVSIADDFNPMGTAGIKLHVKPIDRFSFAPYYGLQIDYLTLKVGYFAGVSADFLF